MVSLGIVTGLSNRRLRLMTATGGLAALAAFCAGAVVLLCKLLFWSSFDPGHAPMVIGLSFLGAVQLASLGIIGDYVGAAFAHPRHYATAAGRTGG